MILIMQDYKNDCYFTSKKTKIIKKTDSSLSVTEPIFKNEARELASELSKLNSNQLGELMGVSEAIAELNVERYKN